MKYATQHKMCYSKQEILMTKSKCYENGTCTSKVCQLIKNYFVGNNL